MKVEANWWTFSHKVGRFYQCMLLTRRSWTVRTSFELTWMMDDPWKFEYPRGDTLCWMPPALHDYRELVFSASTQANTTFPAEHFVKAFQT